MSKARRRDTAAAASPAALSTASLAPQSRHLPFMPSDRSEVDSLAVDSPSQAPQPGAPTPGGVWKRPTARPRPAAAPSPHTRRPVLPPPPPMGEPGRAASARHLAHSIRKGGGCIGTGPRGHSRCGAAHRRQSGGVLGPPGSVTGAVPGQAAALRGAPRSDGGSVGLEKCGRPQGGRGTPPEATAAGSCPPPRLAPRRGSALFEGEAGRAQRRRRREGRKVAPGPAVVP